MKKMYFIIPICAIIIFALYIGIKVYDDNYKPTIISLIEKDIKRYLRAPSSYKLIKAEIIPFDNRIMCIIEYDADNAFGASLRRNATYKIVLGYKNKEETTYIENFNEIRMVVIDEESKYSALFDDSKTYRSVYNKMPKNIIYTGYKVKYKKICEEKSCEIKEHIELITDGQYVFDPKNIGDKFKLVLNSIFINIKNIF